MGEALKPPFTYFGGKTQVADRIAALMPSHEHYVEPFAGSLAVLLAKQPSRMETVNDIDGDLMTFWRVLRDRPAELIRACAMTPHSRSEYVSAYEPALDDLERARRTWVIISQGRSGTLKRTGWRVCVDPAGRSGSMPGDLAGYVARMEQVAQRLSNVTLECRPALDLIRTHGAFESNLLYIDPPYLGASRSGGLNYQHEMPGEAAHRELAGALADCRATVLVSGYQTQLYAQLYGGWHVARISSGSGQGSVWKDRTEVLWSSRPFPQGSLFDQEEAS